MTRGQQIYCRDILDRIRRIESYTSGGREAFIASELSQDGVIRSLEVIGEVVKRMDLSLLAQHPDIAWSDFAGFRDVLIHQYNNVRIDLVWRFAQEDLPALKQAVTALLRHLEDAADSSGALSDG
ncbi:MAG: DUF86 domain-containing protein [Chloroflexi bacterium]|nr:DUF86 domain-containing protein [Chloroflexota bacterium]